MDIRYLKHSEIDKVRWDRTVSQSENGMVYAETWYLDIVCPGWHALIAGDYDFVFPLTARKKFGFSYLYQPAFTQQGGIFGKNISQEVVQDFLLNIPTQFKLVEIQMNTSNTVDNISGFEIFKKRTYHLSLSDGIDALRKNYSENLRRNLKKASKAEVEIVDNATIEELITLFKSNRGKEGTNLKESDYDCLKLLINEAQKKGRISMPSVRNDKGELIAGAVFLQSLHSLIFLFSATNTQAKELGAMSMIIDDTICKNAGRGNAVLDFEGSMDEDLARYYRGFGSKEIVYLQIRKNNLPALIRRLK